MSTLPTGWSTCKFSDCLIQKPQKVDPKRFGDFPYLAMDDIESNTGRILSQKKGADFKSQCARYEKGDLLYGRLRPYLNKVARAPFDGLASAELLVYQSSGAIDLDFAVKMLRSQKFLNHSSIKSKGDRPRLSPKSLSEFQFSLPPLPEQKRIVVKLESLESTTNGVAKDLKRIEDLLEVYKFKLIKKAISGKLNLDGSNVEFQKPPNPELYSIPKSWNWTPLPLIGTLGRGKSKHRPRNDPALFGKKYPFVQTGDVKKRIKTVEDVTAFYSEFGLKQSKLWPAGTLMITIAANIADTHVLPFQACFPDSVVGFTPDASKANVNFIELFFRVEKDRLDRYAPAVAQKNINLRILQNVLVPLPPLTEQVAIVAQVRLIFERIKTIEKSVTVCRERLERLNKSILAKAFRGDLVDQDSNDEPAMVLLKRTKAKETETANKLKNKTSIAKKSRKVISKMTVHEQIGEALNKAPKRGITFEDLKKQVSGTYDEIQNAVFELLGDPSSLLRQRFDEQSETLRFVRE